MSCAVLSVFQFSVCRSKEKATRELPDKVSMIISWLIPADERTSLAVLFADGKVLLNIVRRPQDHWDPFVDGGGLDVQDVDGAGGGHASGLLHDVSHGVALVQQPQLVGSKREIKFEIEKNQP